MNINKFLKHFTFRLLMKKTAFFMIPWTLAFLAVFHYRPDLIDLNRLVSNIFSNTLVFFMGYVLAIFGFQYTAGKDDDIRKPRDH